MKKKLLFIMPSLEGEGAEKSLVTLIGALDSKIYEIHILLFEKKGIFLSELPPEVKILEPVEVLGNFSKPLRESIDSLHKKIRA